MVTIKENDISPVNLINKYFDQQKSELLHGSSKILTKDLETSDSNKYQKVELTRNDLVEKLRLLQNACIAKQSVELLHNKFNLSEPEGNACQDEILRAAFGREQTIFANVRFKDDDDLGFGLLVKVNKYISQNGMKLFKREVAKFDPSSDLETNIRGIFNGLQFKILTPETLKVWFLLTTLYKHVLQSSDRQPYLEIDFKDYHNLIQINFLFCNVNMIPAKAFNDNFVSLSALKKLVLMGNNIKEIHPDAFSTLHKLETLNLSVNSLEKILPQWFAPLFNLKHLDISNNKLKEVSSGVFHELTKLEELDLFGTSNSYKYESGVFEGLENLRTLKLAGIDGIEPDMFDQLSNLSSLSLDNFFKERLFDERFFENLVNLEHCLLQNDTIGTLKIGFMSKQLKLKFLTIQDCSIKKIEAKAFNHLKELTDIYLLSAGLEHIDKKTFKGLKKLQKIDLSYNRFEEGHIFGFDEISEDMIYNL